MTEEHHRLALPQGTRIDDFEFHRVLGHGGFGLTYLGWNLRLDIPVAIKEYLPSDLAVREQDLSVVPKASSDASDFRWGLDRFVDEARTLARFQHPNIVRVHHFFEAHGTAYIVMEYAEGETLSEVLVRRGTLREAELLGIVRPLLDGLAVVHEANVLHRDIKPGNIILRDADSSPVLLDFGSARQAIGARSRSMTTVVTPGYAPIEQYSVRGNQGPWTDLYALGGVCYWALTGRVPADATDRVRRDPVVPIGQLCGGPVSAATLAAIDWAVAVDEKERPQNVAAWRSELLGEEVVPRAEPAVGSSSLWSKAVDRIRHKRTESSVGSAPVVPSANLKRVFGIVLGLCLVVGVGAGGYWGLGQLEQARQEQALEAEVAGLLSAAAADVEAGRLTSPAGTNAWEQYQQVLALVPGHADAQAGLAAIIARYGVLFDGALSAGNFRLASGYIDRVRAVYPAAIELGVWGRRLDSAQAAAARQAAAALEQQRQAAAARQAEVERQRQAEVARQTELALQAEAARQAELTRQAAAARQRKVKALEQQHGLAFVWIAPGTFQMGSPSSEEGRQADEGPVHEVEIRSGFWLGVHEITQGQWESVMGTTPWSGKNNVRSNRSHPAVYISWDDVQAFIGRLNAAVGAPVYRLPSEAEWEYACRAGTSTRWSFGDDKSQLMHYAWYDANAENVGEEYAHAVGQKRPNDWGLHDMHGNVWEWVQDWYDGGYYRRSPRVDPLGLSFGSRRVVRGGDFGNTAHWLRSAYRSLEPPDRRNSVLGVRLLRMR